MLNSSKKILKSDLSSAKFIKQGMPDVLKFLESLENKEYKLRTTQKEALDALLTSTDERIAHSYLKLPTGVGKTIMFSLLSKAYLDESKKEGKQKKVLILVPRLILIGQTQEKLKYFGIASSEFSSQKKNINSDVIISTYQSLNALLQQIKSKDIGIIFADEAHHILGEKISKKLTDLMEKVSTSIGFTATPEYDVDKSVSKILSNEIYSATLSECIDKGELCPVKNIFYRSAMVCDLSQVAKNKGGSRDYDYTKLKIPTDKLIDEIAKIYIYGNDDNKPFSLRKTIINCPNQEIADKQAKRINELSEQEYGRKLGMAVSIHSDCSNFKELQQSFKEGGFHVACQVGTMIEGFDDPNVSLCINYPTNSRVKEEQSAGRVLRISEDIPNKTAIVVDVMFKAYDTEQLENILESANNAKQILFYQIAGNCILGNIDKNKKEKKTENNKQGKRKETELLEGDFITDSDILLNLVSKEKKRHAQQANISEKTEEWKTSQEISIYFLEGEDKIRDILDTLYKKCPEKEREDILEKRKSYSRTSLCVNINRLDALIELAGKYNIKLNLANKDIKKKTEEWKAAYELAIYFLEERDKIRDILRTLYKKCPKKELEGILEERKSYSKTSLCVNINRLDALIELAGRYSIVLNLANQVKKTEKWKIASELAIYFLEGDNKIRDILDTLYKKCPEKEREDILEKRKSYSRTSICVNINRLDDFIELARRFNIKLNLAKQDIKKKTEKWKAAHEIAMYFLEGENKIRDILRVLYKKCPEKGREDILEERKSGKHTTICININRLDDLIQLAKDYNIELNLKTTNDEKDTQTKDYSKGTLNLKIKKEQQKIIKQRKKDSDSNQY